MTQPGPGEGRATTSTDAFRVPVRALLALALPAAVVGLLCGLSLIALSALAEVVEGWVWDDLSRALGLDRGSPVWIVVVLTATGLLVGLVVRYAPGHAGPDPATAGLVEPPLPPRTLPGLAVALVLTLAGGVSLGPENPIMAINAAVVVWLGARAVRRVPVPQWMALSTAGTIGAMFGTPLAAALMFSELDPGDRRIPLWDRLFAPLVSASTGALTMLLLSDLDMAMDLPPYPGLQIGHLAIAVVVSLGAAALGLVAAYLITPLHRLAHRVRNPVVLLTLGGFVLGLLGVLGGPITLFKGLEEMQELPDLVGTTTALGFLAFALVKLAALLVASSVGFRGGRIFPATFVGVALGFAVHVAWPAVPIALAVGAATVGIVVAATRSGWLSIFLVVAIVPEATLVPPLLFGSLAAWLLVTNRPELRAIPTPPLPPPPPPPQPPSPAAGRDR